MTEKIKAALTAGDFETAGDILSDIIAARFPSFDLMDCGLWNTRRGGVISSGHITSEAASNYGLFGGEGLIETHNQIKRFIEETAAGAGLHKVEFSLLGSEGKPIEYGAAGDETLFYDIWLKPETD